MTSKQISPRVKGRFAPGFSGNPTGRPPVPKPIQEMLGSLVEPAAKAIAEALQGNDPRLKLIAAQEVFNRVYGKAQATVEVKGMDAPTAHMNALQALTAMAKAAPIIDLEPEEIEDVTNVE